MCQAFEFKHLPEPGGLLDQHPDILERFLFILQRQAQQRQREENERKRREGGSMGKGRRVAGRR